MSPALPAWAEEPRPLTAPLPLLEGADGLEGNREPEDEPRADAALRAARQAWVEWRRAPQSERAATLRDVATAVDDAADELAELNVKETGRRFPDALAGVRAGAEALRRYAELSLMRSGPSLAGVVTGVDFTIFEPRGVVLGLTSWDDPVATASGIAGASLAAGNVALLKPSERCSHLGQRLGEIFESVTPPGVLRTVLGGPQLGEALAGDPRVDAVVHLGSSDVGRRLALATSRTSAHLVLVPSGTGSVIVDRGVDTEWAASRVAEAAFRHAGQHRSATGRVYVLDDVEASFIEALAQEALAWADPERVGPLVDEQARASVHGVVASSVAEGAIAVVGGAVPDGPGAYYPPTVLARCTPLMQAMRTEARGPVAAVMTVHNFEEALAEAAEPPIGPSATVLTQDIGHAQLAVAELPVATLVINGIAQSTTDAPSLPQSGMPTDFGPGLLDELSRSKSVHLEPPVAARARRH